MLLNENFSNFFINFKKNIIITMTQELIVEKKKPKTSDNFELGVKMALAYGPVKALRMVHSKKGNFNMLSGVAKSLVVFGIMIGVGVLILTKFQASTNSSSEAYKQIGSVIGLFSSLTTWGGIVLIVIMGYVILRYLGVFERE